MALRRIAKKLNAVFQEISNGKRVALFMSAERQRFEIEKFMSWADANGRAQPEYEKLARKWNWALNKITVFDRDPNSLRSWNSNMAMYPKDNDQRYLGLSLKEMVFGKGKYMEAKLSKREEKVFDPQKSAWGKMQREVNMSVGSELQQLPEDSKLKLVIVKRAYDFMAQSAGDDHPVHVYVIDRTEATLADVKQYALPPANVNLVLLHFNSRDRANANKENNGYNPEITAEAPVQ